MNLRNGFTRDRRARRKLSAGESLALDTEISEQGRHLVGKADFG